MRPVTLPLLVGVFGALGCGASELDLGDALPGESAEPSAPGVPGVPYLPPLAVCSDGDERPSSLACGLNGRGFFREACVGGEWLVGRQCVDSDTCIDGTRREASAPCGTAGQEQEQCVNGAWTEGTCLEAFDCQTDDARVGTTACGINGRGRLEEACNAGAWVDTQTCDDPDTCFDGLRKAGPDSCGLNDNGTVLEACKFGQWATEGCDDPDVCAEGTESVTGSCPGGGSIISVCEAGQWTAARDCDTCGDVKLFGSASAFTDEQLQALAGVTWITERLTVGRNVTSLQPLQSLRCVDELFIEDTQLSNLEGLEGLRQLRFGRILENQELESLGGLEGLEHVFADLYVFDSPKLARLTELSARFRFLRLSDLPALTSLDGLAGIGAGRLDLRRIPRLRSLAGIEGSHLEGFVASDMEALTDLSALRQSEALEVLGLVDLPEVDSLEGVLPPERTHWRQLSLSRTPITDLSPLVSIERLDSLAMFDMPLVDLRGLGGLRRADFLSLQNNRNLVSLSGLHNLERVGRFFMGGNTELATLPAFTKVFEVGALGIDDTALTKLEAFPVLQRVRDELRIDTNSALQTITFPALRRIEGRLTVSGNPQLATLSFPELLVAAHADVAGNSSLGTCLAEALADQVRSPGGGPSLWTITDNGPCP